MNTLIEILFMIVIGFSVYIFTTIILATIGISDELVKCTSLIYSGMVVFYISLYFKIQPPTRPA